MNIRSHTTVTPHLLRKRLAGTVEGKVVEKMAFFRMGIFPAYFNGHTVRRENYKLAEVTLWRLHLERTEASCWILICMIIDEQKNRICIVINDSVHK